VASFYQVRSPYGVLLGKLDGKTSLGGIRCRWGKNTKTGLQELGWRGWIVLAKDRGGRWALVNAVMNLRVPKKARNFFNYMRIC
jgi:hypothetical protein